MTRPGWDDYFLGIAAAVAARADCTRRQVACVIVDDRHRIVSTGYNGAPAGHPGCASAGACPRGRATAEEVPHGSSYDTGAGACIAVHAEANALIYGDATRYRGGTAYITHAPCDGCARLLAGAGLLWVIWPGNRWGPLSSPVARVPVTRGAVYVPGGVVTEEPLCHAGRDGECYWSECPQLRDGEPRRSHRHCPLDTSTDEDHGL